MNVQKILILFHYNIIKTTTTKKTTRQIEILENEMFEEEEEINLFLNLISYFSIK